MIYNVKVAVCSENRTKHVAQCGHHVEFLNVTLGSIQFLSARGSVITCL
jgi:hypothetical protein